MTSRHAKGKYLCAIGGGGRHEVLPFVLFNVPAGCELFNLHRTTRRNLTDSSRRRWQRCVNPRRSVNVVPNRARPRAMWTALSDNDIDENFFKFQRKNETSSRSVHLLHSDSVTVTLNHCITSRKNWTEVGQVGSTVEGSCWSPDQQEHSTVLPTWLTYVQFFRLVIQWFRTDGREICVLLCFVLLVSVYP